MLLINPFEGIVFGKREKQDELYNYFIDPDDEAKINKARYEEPIFVYLMGFKLAMDVSNFSPFQLLFNLTSMLINSFIM